MHGAEVQTGLWGSTKACFPVIFTAKPLEGMCALEHSQILHDIEAVYLSLPACILRFLSQAFHPFLSHLSFICDLFFGVACRFKCLADLSNRYGSFGAIGY